VGVDELINLFQTLSKSNLSETAMVLIFVYTAIVRPVKLRLRVVSGYIRRYLTISRKQALATERLSKSIQSLLDRRKPHGQ
jgi:hypothetical protein